MYPDGDYTPKRCPPCEREYRAWIRSEEGQKHQEAMLEDLRKRREALEEKRKIEEKERKESWERDKNNFKNAMRENPKQFTIFLIILFGTFFIFFTLMCSGGASSQ